MKTIDSRKLVSKKVLIPVILGIGVLLLSAIFIASPIAYTWAQQQQALANYTFMRAQDTSN